MEKRIAELQVLITNLNADLTELVNNPDIASPEYRKTVETKLDEVDSHIAELESLIFGIQ